MNAGAMIRRLLLIPGLSLSVISCAPTPPPALTPAPATAPQTAPCTQPVVVYVPVSCPSTQPAPEQQNASIVEIKLQLGILGQRLSAISERLAFCNQMVAQNRKEAIWLWQAQSRLASDLDQQSERQEARLESQDQADEDRLTAALKQAEAKYSANFDRLSAKLDELQATRRNGGAWIIAWILILCAILAGISIVCNYNLRSRRMNR